MKKHLSKKRVVLAAIVAVALAIASGVAYAYFTSGGNGSGTGKVGTSTSFTVTGATESASLYPYTQTQLTSTPALYTALTGGSVMNPATATGDQYLTKLVATIVAPTGGVGGTPACTATDFRLYSPAGTWAISGTNFGVATISPTTGNTLAPGASYLMTDLSVAMVDSGANQNACQGATVNITYAAT
jgi:hypothetical protein